MSRPPYYPFHNIQQTNIIFPQDSLFVLSGYPQGLPVPSADHNGKLNSSYLWHSYLDQGTLRNTDWLTLDATALMTTMLEYNVGGNVTTTGATVFSYPAYLVNGNRVEIDNAALNQVGAAVQGSPLVFAGATTPGRIWVYVNPDTQVRFESVAPATADAPVGNEITLIGLDIDALGVVTDGAVVPTTLPLPNYQLNAGIPVTITTGTETALTVTSLNGPGNIAVSITADTGSGLLVQNASLTDATVTIENNLGSPEVALAVTSGDVSLTNTLFVGGYAFVTQAIVGYDDVVAGADLTANYGSLFVGIDAFIGYDLNVGMDAFINGTLLSTLGISSDGFLMVDGDVDLCVGAGNKTLTIGTDSADVITSAATTTFSSNVNLCTGAGNFTCTIGSATADTLTINATVGSFSFGANTITGSGGTVSCTNVSATNVTAEELRFQDSATTLPGTAGRVRWNNTFFSFLDSTSVVRTFDEPVRGFDAQLATAANPLTDTTASATRRVKHNEPVWIEMGSHVSTDSGGSNANYQLRITGPLGTADVVTDAVVMATAAKGYVWQEYFYWTPTDSFGAETNPQNYVFLVRMGTSAGNLTADRIGIKVSSAIQV